MMVSFFSGKIIVRKELNCRRDQERRHRMDAGGNVGAT